MKLLFKPIFNVAHLDALKSWNNIKNEQYSDNNKKLKPLQSHVISYVYNCQHIE